jgi:hypothetical protein
VAVDVVSIYGGSTNDGKLSNKIIPMMVFCGVSDDAVPRGNEKEE